MSKQMSNQSGEFIDKTLLGLNTAKRRLIVLENQILNAISTVDNPMIKVLIDTDAGLTMAHELGEIRQYIETIAVAIDDEFGSNNSEDSDLDIED